MTMFRTALLAFNKFIEISSEYSFIFRDKKNSNVGVGLKRVGAIFRPMADVVTLGLTNTFPGFTNTLINKRKVYNSVQSQRVKSSAQGSNKRRVPGLEPVLGTRPGSLAVNTSKG